MTQGLASTCRASLHACELPRSARRRRGHACICTTGATTRLLQQQHEMPPELRCGTRQQRVVHKGLAPQICAPSLPQALCVLARSCTMRFAMSVCAGFCWQCPQSHSLLLLLSCMHCLVWRLPGVSVVRHAGSLTFAASGVCAGCLSCFVLALLMVAFARCL